MNQFSFFMIFFMLIITQLISTPDESPMRWTVVYNAAPLFQSFEPYSLIVLDSDEHPPLQPLKEKNKTVIGYLSLGEVEDFRPHFEKAKAAGILLEENENWKGSYMVDLRNPAWTKMVIEELIPSILNQRFDGLMFDTLDNAEYLEEKDPEKYAGMVQAAEELIHAIRQHYPQAILIVNRGFEILPEIARDIDYVLAESTYTTHNFETNQPEVLPEEVRKEYVDMIQEGLKENPQLKVLSLDYWPSSDQQKVQEIYRAQREQGYFPYVSEVELNRIVHEQAIP